MNQRLGAAAARAELPVRQQRTEQVFRGASAQVVGVHAAEVLAAETIDQTALRWLQALRGQGQDRFHRLGFQGFKGVVHRGASSWSQAVNCEPAPIRSKVAVRGICVSRSRLAPCESILYFAATQPSLRRRA